MGKKNVVILTANSRSALTVSVLHGLRENNVNVQAVVVKNSASTRRLMKELKSNGFVFLKKIFRKLFLQSLVTTPLVDKYLDGFSLYYKNCKIIDRSVQEFCAKGSIDILTCEDFHEANLLDRLELARPDLVIFTGGGIIRKAMLDVPTIGVLNCHMGVLPGYRGVDSVNWALLNREPSSIGYTTHLMDEGIDTGPIVQKYSLGIDVINQLRTVRNIEKAIEYRVCEALISDCIKLLDNNMVLINQKDSDGRQYFKMHKTLRNKIIN